MPHKCHKPIGFKIFGWQITFKKVCKLGGMENDDRN